MDRNKICEALYALPDGVVVRRRKPLLVPGTVLLAGAALIVINNQFRSALSDDMRSALVFIGGAVAIVGVIMLLARMFGSSGTPYHRLSKNYLRFEEFYFDHKMWHDVAQCIQEGDVARLRTLQHSNVPAVTVALYSTPDGRFNAAQAFEYADLEYRPLSELRVIEK